MKKTGYKYNKSLLTYISINKIEKLRENTSDTWQNFLNEGVVKFDDCYYFNRFAPKGPTSKDLVDKTGNESFYNKVHIDDFFPENNDNQFYLEKGIELSFELASNLESLNDAFLIFLSFDGEYCIVSFHKKRKDEYWLVDDIEKYEDAILVIDIP